MWGLLVQQVRLAQKETLVQQELLELELLLLEQLLQLPIFLHCQAPPEKFGLFHLMVMPMDGMPLQQVGLI
jgi:hypothetical protein